MKIKTFVFDVGDSTNGPVGAVVRVNATTAAEALELLQAHVPEGSTIPNSSAPGTVVVRVYFGDKGWPKPRIER